MLGQVVPGARRADEPRTLRGDKTSLSEPREDGANDGPTDTLAQPTRHAAAFGDEPWIYPDNFNHYRQESATGNEVVWSDPGYAWSVGDLNSSKFEELLGAYRQHVRNPDTGGPTEFTKHIRLNGTRIDVEYDGVKSRPPGCQ